ncbi:MAG TPA: hypothetical protein VM537_12865 [Anaerolineae bacterium]|nr:hypothetical protein [Anaerolineae bacterium]
MSQRRKARDDRWYVLAYWRILRRALDWHKGLPILLTAGIATLLMTRTQDLDKSTWGVSSAVWLAVTGSVLASALFGLIQWVISSAAESSQSLLKDSYRGLVEENGIRQVFSQRGDDVVLKVYKELIARAEERVWAIGQTNRHFTDQHKDALAKALDRRGMDVVVAFWNPLTELVTPSHAVGRRCIVEVQSAIERTPGSSEGWRNEIAQRQASLAAAFSKAEPMKGQWRIANVSCVTNFTCMIVDDDVFFFPFLSGPDSTNNPTVWCSATHGVGRAIVDHIEKLLANSDICCVVQSSQGGSATPVGEAVVL